jgi:hypothetical protein
MQSVDENRQEYQMSGRDNVAMEKLSGRVSMLEDERHIGGLMAQYAHLIDHDRVAEWVDCFTPDGRFEVRRPGSEPLVTLGRDALTEFATSRPPRAVPTKHFASQVMTEVEGDTATSTSYFAILSDIDGGPSLNFYGRYVDELVRCDDALWRFKSRIATGESRRP